MKELQPIGIFDSGVGGLTVARFVFSSFPNRQILYFGDTAHIPYGSRSTEEIIKYGEQIVTFLLQHGAGVIVAACNTSSSVSLSILQKNFSLPVIGMIEPAVRAALRVSKEKRIGVIATAATVQSESFPATFRKFDPEVKVFMQACPLFVTFVEAGKIDTPEVRKTAQAYLDPLVKEGIDTLVLGCTHYPFLLPVLRDIVGSGVQIVDPAAEVAQELVSVLNCKDESLVDFQKQEVKHRFFVSGPAQSFDYFGRLVFGKFPYNVEKVNL